MSDFNPYQAPQVEQIHQAMAPAPNQGVWSDGKLLVVSQEATLPSLCVLTNQKPQKAIERKFYWHTPGLYFLIFVGILFYAILALILRKSQTLAIPLSEPALEKRKNGLTVCWVIGLAFVAVIVGGGVVGFGEALGQNETIGVLLFVGGLLGLLVTAVVGSKYAAILTPKKITDQAGWYKGASAEYLASLPSFPPNTPGHGLQPSHASHVGTKVQPGVEEWLTYGTSLISDGHGYFPDWSAFMLREFDNDVKPHLKECYDASESISNQPRNQWPQLIRERVANAGLGL